MGWDGSSTVPAFLNVFHNFVHLLILKKYPSCCFLVYLPKDLLIFFSWFPAYVHPPTLSPICLVSLQVALASHFSPCFVRSDGLISLNLSPWLSSSPESFFLYWLWLHFSSFEHKWPQLCSVFQTRSSSVIFFFPFLSLLERLIIMQVRFLYLLVWLRAVFCGTAEVLCFCSHLLLENAHEVS